MIDKVKKTIKQHKLLKKGDHVIVGVSGGPDSMSLLHVLFLIKESYQLKISVVHINHMLRGIEADKDELYVKDYCNALKIPFYSYKIEIREMSKSLGISEEEAGRKARYDAFNEILKKVGADKIAIAQNMNDQAETLLMRLTRGSGLDGLSGIDYKREDTIIRPLLDITRKEIEDFCRDYALNPRIDKTNLKPIYTRNKIRLELIPYLAENFNNRIVYNLWKTAKILKEDRHLIQTIVDDVYQIASREHEDKIYLKNAVFQGQHPSIKKRLLLKAAGRLGVQKDITTIHLENALSLIEENKTSSGVDLPLDIRIEIGYEDIIVSKKRQKEISQPFCYELKWGNNIEIEPLNSVIESEVVTKEKKITVSKEKYIKYFDFDKIQLPVKIRTRREGDFFVPLGMKGRKKIKDFFIDEKIPKSLRGQIPLVCCGSEILWVIGYRISENYKVDEKTKNILILRYKE